MSGQSKVQLLAARLQEASASSSRVFITSLNSASTLITTTDKGHWLLLPHFLLQCKNNSRVSVKILVQFSIFSGEKTLKHVT